MQTVAQNINPDALGTGALVRSCAFGFLPVAPERAVVLLAARAAALTHGHPEALASAAAYALLTRDVLAGACGSEQGKKNSIADSVRRVIDWCGSIPAEEAFPADAAHTREALVKALALQDTEPTPEAVAEHFGTDWLCYTVLGIAVWNTLYCSARISAPRGRASGGSYAGGLGRFRLRLDWCHYRHPAGRTRGYARGHAAAT